MNKGKGELKEKKLNEYDINYAYKLYFDKL